MTLWVSRTWARSISQLVTGRVLIGQISEPTQPISSQTVISVEHLISVVIHVLMKTGLGVTGVDVSGTSVC